MIRPVAAFGALLFAIAPAAAGDDISSFPGIDQLPAGYKADDTFISRLGIPYTLGDLTQLPTNPIYWIDKGKIIAFEVVIDDKQLKGQKDLRHIQPIDGLPPIDQVDLTFDFARGKWALPIWVLRVQFVSDEYLAQMTGR